MNEGKKKREKREREKKTEGREAKKKREAETGIEPSLTLRVPCNPRFSPLHSPVIAAVIGQGVAENGDAVTICGSVPLVTHRERTHGPEGEGSGWINPQTG